MELNYPQWVMMAIVCDIFPEEINISRGMRRGIWKLTSCKLLYISLIIPQGMPVLIALPDSIIISPA